MTLRKRISPCLHFHIYDVRIAQLTYSATCSKGLNSGPCEAFGTGQPVTSANVSQYSWLVPGGATSQVKLLFSALQVQFGHAGACANQASETAVAKNQALKEAGVFVPRSFDELGEIIQ